MDPQTTTQRPIKAFLGVAADVAMPVLDVLEPALALVPIPGLGLIPRTLSDVLKNVERARVNAEARKAFISQVEALGALIARLAYPNEALAHSGTGGSERRMGKAIDRVVQSDELIKGIQDLERKMKVLEARAVALAPVGNASDSVLRQWVQSIRGMLRASKDAIVVADMQRDLSAAIEQFRFRANAAIDRGVQEVRRLLLEAEEDRLLEKLCSVDVGYRSVSEPKSQLMEGTRESILEGLRKWCTGHVPDPVAPKRVYFVSGGAGVGKSSVAYRHCVQLSEPSSATDAPRLGASIFIDRNRGGLTVELLFHALARQLAESLPVLRPHILDAAREYLKKGQRQLPEFSFKELLHEPLSRAAAEIPVGLRLVVVIDGLDECDEQPALQDGIRRLLELVTKFPWLYLFLASRPVPSIMTVLEGSMAAAIVHHYDLQQDLMNRADVKMFLESSVPQIPKYSSFLETHPSYLEELVERADGLFIFARIALNVLNQDLYRDNPEEGFQVVLSKENGLDKMDALYLGILRAAFPPRDLVQSPRLHARLLSFLHVVALLRSPLSPGCVALFADDIHGRSYILGRVGNGAQKQKALTLDDFVPIINLLRSVIYTDPSHGRLMPIHMSFYEFLVDRCTDPQYRVDRCAGHAALALSCLSLVFPRGVKDAVCHLHRVDLEHNYWLQAFLYGFSGNVSLPGHIGGAIPHEELKDALHTALTTAWFPYWTRIAVWAETPGQPASNLSRVSNRIQKLVITFLRAASLSMGSRADSIYAHDFGRYCSLYLRLMIAVPDAPPQWVNKVARNAMLSNGEVALHYLEETDFRGDNLHIDGTEGMAHPQLESQRANFISRYEQCWKCVWDALGQDPELLECWYKVAT